MTRSRLTFALFLGALLASPASRLPSAPAAANRADAPCDEVSHGTLPSRPADTERASTGVDWLMEELRRSRQAVQERESELETRELYLKALEDRIVGRLEEFKQAERSLEQLVESVDRVHREKIKRMARAYEAMSPENAAEIIVALVKEDQETAVGILSMMEPRKSGRVLEAIVRTDPALAASLTIRASRLQSAT